MLITSDFYPYIRETNLNEVIDNREYFLKEVIIVAESEAQQYTSTYFDNSCLYPSLEEVELSAIYSPDELFYYSDDIYKVTATVSFLNYSDIKDEIGTSLIKTDPRDKYLKMILIDIALYHIHSRISPNMIPELRVVRYEQALMKLENINQGLLGGIDTACLKKDEDNNEIVNFRYGGDDQINNKW